MNENPSSRLGVSQLVSGARVAVYYRVSSALQTTECQKPDVMALLARHGWTAAAIYEEQASAVKRRPQFEKMMAAATDGKFDVLVVWALDRFGRSMAGNVRDLLALDELGVRVVSVKEPWLDSGGPVRELLVAIFSWVAQQERARLIERTRAGIAAARAGGAVWGRPSRGLLPAGEREAVMDRWVEEGRPDGFKGLAAVLGCASATTAMKLWKTRAGAGVTVASPSVEADSGHPQKTEDAPGVVALD